MKWISFYQNEQRQVGILKDDKVLPLRQLGYLFEDIGELIKSDKDRFLEIVDAVNKSTFIESVNNVEITSPITIPFQDIICVGLNYVEHCKEANEYHKDNFSLKTDATVFFQKELTRYHRQMLIYRTIVNLQKDLITKQNLLLFLVLIVPNAHWIMLKIRYLDIQ